MVTEKIERNRLYENISQFFTPLRVLFINMWV